MADMAIRLAREPRPQVRETRWSTMIAGRSQGQRERATMA
jgi:hypothetical protein